LPAETLLSPRAAHRFHFLDHWRGTRLHRRGLSHRRLRISGVARFPCRALLATTLRVLRRPRLHIDDHGASADQRQRGALSSADEGAAAAAGELRRIVVDGAFDRGRRASEFIAAIEVTME